MHEMDFADKTDEQIDAQNELQREEELIDSLPIIEHATYKSRVKLSPVLRK